MRYHLVVWIVPDIHSTEQVPIVDEEFDFHESRHKVVDIFYAAIEQAKAEGGQEEGTVAGMPKYLTPAPTNEPDRAEYDDDKDAKDMDPHYE